MEKAQFRLEIDLMSFHEVFYMKSQLVIASSKALSIINKRMQHFVIFPYSSFTLSSKLPCRTVLCGSHRPQLNCHLKVFFLPSQFWHLNLSRTNWRWEVTILFHENFWSLGWRRNISFSIFTKTVSKHLFSDPSHRGTSVSAETGTETHVFNLPTIPFPTRDPYITILWIYTSKEA